MKELNIEVSPLFEILGTQNSNLSKESMLSPLQ
jgi:hypothetical protein